MAFGKNGHSGGGGGVGFEWHVLLTIEGTHCNARGALELPDEPALEQAVIATAAAIRNERY